MLRALLITFIPVSGCVTASVRDTERGVWPQAYDRGTYYVVGWKQKFIAKPGPTEWRQ